jgi:hypothetical protein
MQNAGKSCNLSRIKYENSWQGDDRGRCLASTHRRLSIVQFVRKRIKDSQYLANSSCVISNLSGRTLMVLIQHSYSTCMKQLTMIRLENIIFCVRPDKTIRRRSALFGQSFRQTSKSVRLYKRCKQLPVSPSVFVWSKHWQCFWSPKSTARKHCYAIADQLISSSAHQHISQSQCSRYIWKKCFVLSEIAAKYSYGEKQCQSSSLTITEVILTPICQKCCQMPVSKWSPFHP